jgi:predicted nucleic acid-binding protein
VLDASAVLEILSPGGAGDRARVEIRGNRLAAPAHLDAEVLSALARRNRAGDLSEGQVEAAIRSLAQAPIRRYPLQGLLFEAWSMRHNVAIRDALYIALTRRLAARLLTADFRLSRAPRLGISVTTV